MRRGHVVVLVAVTSGLLSVLLAVAVNIATNGGLPAPLAGVAGLAWPAVGLFSAIAVALAVWQQRLAQPSELPVDNEPESQLPAELPAAPTGFSGRAQDLADIDDLIAGGRRVIALVGPPGVGKSSLALRIAHDTLSMRVDNIDDSRHNSRHSLRLHFAATLLVIAALAVTGCVVHRDSADTRKAPATLHNSWLRKHPPVAGPTVVDRSSRYWTLFMWVSTDDQLCIAAVGSADNDDDLTCFAAPSVLRSEGPPALASKPLPQAVPHESDKTLVIGAVRGRVAVVDVTAFGATVTGRVISLPAEDDRLVGAYAAWMPRQGRDGLSWSDITKVVARDKHKRALHQIA